MANPKYDPTQYPRRQTPEEISERLTPVNDGFPVETTPPFGKTSVESSVDKALRELEEMRHNYAMAEGTCMSMIEAMEKKASVPTPQKQFQTAPPHEISDFAAEARFREKLAKATVTLCDCGKCQARRPPTLAPSCGPDPLVNLATFLDYLEKTPTVENLHVPGAKADTDKLDLTLVPVELEEAVAEIMMFGARKYTRDGWRSVPDAGRRYFAALERHLKAFKRGEDVDQDSGLHHLAHAACNLAFLLYFLRNVGMEEWRFLGDQR